MLQREKRTLGSGRGEQRNGTAKLAPMQAPAFWLLRRRASSRTDAERWPVASTSGLSHPFWVADQLLQHIIGGKGPEWCLLEHGSTPASGYTPLRKACSFVTSLFYQTYGPGQGRGSKPSPNRLPVAPRRQRRCASADRGRSNIIVGPAGGRSRMIAASVCYPFVPAIDLMLRRARCHCRPPSRTVR